MSSKLWISCSRVSPRARSNGPDPPVTTTRPSANLPQTRNAAAVVLVAVVAVVATVVVATVAARKAKCPPYSRRYQAGLDVIM